MSTQFPKDSNIDAILKMTNDVVLKINNKLEVSN